MCKGTWWNQMESMTTSQKASGTYKTPTNLILKGNGNLEPYCLVLMDILLIILTPHMSEYLVTSIQFNENLRLQEHQNRNIVYFEGISFVDTTKSASRLQAPLKITKQHLAWLGNNLWSACLNPMKPYSYVRTTQQILTNKPPTNFHGDFINPYWEKIWIALSQKFTHICKTSTFWGWSVKFCLYFVRKILILYFFDNTWLCNVPQCTI